MKKNKLTLKDVALQLGVSTATISNAFNRPDQLSAAKREEILSACKRIGYSGPNKAAQILRKGHSSIVALVLADNIEYMVSDPVASMFIKGVSSVLQDAGKHLLLYAGNAESVSEIVDFVDGFICYGAPENPVLGQELNQQDKPVVTVDFDLGDWPSVNIDNEAAAYQIAKHAIRAGDDVAILGLKLIDSPTTCRVYDSPLLDTATAISHRRLDGYKRAMKEKGCKINNELIWHIPESRGNYSRQAAKEVLSISPRPHTILCMSDIIALELLQCALSMEVDVPQTLRITGFDGIDEAKRTRPQLTTVSQSSTDKGKCAAELFLSFSKESVVLPFTIFEGETG
ncbi:LacI family DNA-binding transcriptional regulator [Aestuariibacter sp. A3R04]|uniref:LacI family DNA-binding transcriptional regulator n=1 Tax=Aestuariibacter sp. A3R04 TaxID=2841571 RepID=UPI001C08E6D5|nr:LacI family DNA-binding transcriptional regulator [Aestuariibacter sp. A3R04]MBU3021721.1 LacI family DNA-binding transcriptional regulator [Aestuariibacter sp. A3R04]